MSVRASHRTLAPLAGPTSEAALDVLVGGDERDEPPSRRVLTGIAVVVLLAGAALLLRQGPTDAGPAAGADPVRFGLHPTSVVVPRHVPPAPGRVAVAGLHLELLNTGETAVELLSVALVPGGWEVEVADRHQLRPGWSAVLDLHRQVDCAPGADHGPPPRRLVVRAEVDGRAVVRTVDVGPEQAAYGGRLDDVLGSPGDACDPEAAGPLLGPIGDLFRGPAGG